MKTIIVENKGKGLVVLISNSIVKEISSFKGFKILRVSDYDKYIELLGLDIKLKLSKVTKLNIDKKIILLEEYKDSFRFTFSSSLIKNITKIDEMLIDSS